MTQVHAVTQLPAKMTLRILLPFYVLAECTAVLRIVAETTEGSIGLLPHRLDCVAALLPGILLYETESEGVSYAAVDEGVMIKSGLEVLVSVRNATLGKELSQLREAVKREYLMLDEQEKSVRKVLAKMESNFVRRIEELHRA